MLCRTCLQENPAQNFISINDNISESESINLENKLLACIPELDLNLLDNPMMCLFCIDALEVSYNFKQKCLQTEELVRFKLQTTKDNIFVEADINTDVKVLLRDIKLEPCLTEEFDYIDDLQTSNFDCTDALQENEDNLTDGVVKQEVISGCEVVNETTNNVEVESALMETDEKVILKAFGAIKEQQVSLFVCEICRYVTKHQQRLDRHMRRHTSEKPYKRKKYKLRSGRKKRLKIHNRDETLQCISCKLSFKNLAALNKHTDVAHSKYFDCSKCNFSTKRKFYLRKHEKIHVTSVEYFECNECGYRFMRKEHLKRHVKIHTGVKTLQCPSCQYKAERKDHLQEHMKRKHKNRECSECGLKFAKKSAVRLHMKVHNTKISKIQKQ